MFLIPSFASIEPNLVEQQRFDTIEHKVVIELQRHLVGQDYPHWATDLNWIKLRKFYKNRNFSPIWLFRGQTSNKAAIVRNTLLNADLEGLAPVEYHAPAIAAMWNTKRARSKARLELLLTDALLRYASEVSIGYPHPRSVDHDWKIKPRKINELKILRAFLKAQNSQKYLNSLPPSHQAYKKLKKTLAEYRRMLSEGEWQVIASGSELQLGESDPQVRLIRSRLFRERYLKPDDNIESDYFDAALDKAVRRFQTNYGHKVDGIVGYFTRKSMNISLLDRIAAIKHNMERWRWLPSELGERYIMVNMASYLLDLVENGKTVLKMPVIVGKTYRATPAFIDNIDYVELNPTWKVPPRIAKEKFLPKLKEDAKFLANNRLRIYDSWRKNAKEVDPVNVNWNKYNESWLPYKFVQQPGEMNSMGLVKFMFPNKYRIYLHDTPQKNLFKRYVRTLSSGCIRVSEPLRLANKILEAEISLAGKKVESLLSNGETKVIRVSQPLPVYLMYWTAWVDEEGRVNFRKDVYQRNKNIVTSDESNLS